MEYCVGVVDQSLAEKRTVLEQQVQDPSSKRRVQGEIYSEEVKVRVGSSQS